MNWTPIYYPKTTLKLDQKSDVQGNFLFKQSISHNFFNKQKCFKPWLLVTYAVFICHSFWVQVLCIIIVELWIKVSFRGLILPTYFLGEIDTQRYF